MFVLTKKQIDLCFEHEHQADILFALYREVYDGSVIDRPPWAIVKSVDGWPKIGSAAHKYVTEKFIVHDRLHHRRCIAGGLWMNNGFSHDESLGDWDCVPAPCELL